jgi:hypothetical protein
MEIEDNETKAFSFVKVVQYLDKFSPRYRAHF